MSKCALLIFLVSVSFSETCLPAEAPRSSRLVGGLSPNHHFEVTVEQQRITNYRLRDIVSGKVIKVIRSTFQHDSENGTPDSAWDMSKWADVYWNADSSLVAIDEYPWNRGGGQVTLLALEHGGASAKEVPIPRKTILAQSGQRWDTSRLRIDERAGWATPRRLCLSLAGQTVLKGVAPGRYGYSHFEVWIEIMPDFRVRVLSIKRAPA